MLCAFSRGNCGAPAERRARNSLAFWLVKVRSAATMSFWKAPCSPGLGGSPVMTGGPFSIGGGGGGGGGPPDGGGLDPRAEGGGGLCPPQERGAGVRPGGGARG